MNPKEKLLYQDYGGEIHACMDVGGEIMTECGCQAPREKVFMSSENVTCERCVAARSKRLDVNQS